VIATSYVWVAVVSNKVLGESMSLLKWGGILLILLGVTLVVRS
jgi:drug/metabolite transporter (DMT)-like permease